MQLVEGVGDLHGPLWGNTHTRDTLSDACVLLLFDLCYTTLLYYVKQFWKQHSEAASTSLQTCCGWRHNWWTALHVAYQGNKQKVWTRPSHQETSNSSPHGCEWLSACTSLNISSSGMTKIKSRLILLLNADSTWKIILMIYWNSFLHVWTSACPNMWTTKL